MSAAILRCGVRACLTGLFSRVLLLLGCLFVAQSAWAVRCVTSEGADRFVQPIGSVQTYPVNAPDGYVIWISPTRTTTGYCYKDLGGELCIVLSVNSVLPVACWAGSVGA